MGARFSNTINEEGILYVPYQEAVEQIRCAKEEHKQVKQSFCDLARNKVNNPAFKPSEIKELETEKYILDKYDTEVINLISAVFYDGHNNGVKEFAKFIIDKHETIKDKMDIVDLAMEFINQ